MDNHDAAFDAFWKEHRDHITYMNQYNALRLAFFAGAEYGMECLSKLMRSHNVIGDANDKAN